MKRKILIYSIYIFFIILIQSTVLDYFKILNVKPNLIMVFIVCVALLRGNVEGAAVGFFLGMGHDILSGKVLGFYSLLGLYLGLTIGSLNKRLYRENPLLMIFFTFVSTVVYEWLVYFFGTLLSAFFTGRSGPIDMFYWLKNVIIPEAGYNCVISIPVFILIVKTHRKFEEIDKEARKY